MRFLSITKVDFVDAEDIVVAILHDTIEDHPKYIPEIREKFPNPSVYFRVLGLSKPSANIMTDIYTNYVRAIIRSPELFFQ
jgi:(p)ppGpp synthase/HD superfamily hydrolase